MHQVIWYGFWWRIIHRGSLAWSSKLPLQTTACQCQCNCNLQVRHQFSNPLCILYPIVSRSFRAARLHEKLHGNTKVFNSVCEIKKEVCDACDCEISSESFELGHGYKGRQHWLISDEDVKDMCHIYEGKKEILLWSTQADHQRKCAHSPDVEESEKRSRYDKYLDRS